MKLADCTKAELITIINRLTAAPFSSVGSYHLKIILRDMEYERQKKKLKEAENWGIIADEARQQYIELIKKYEGVRFVDVPLDELEKAEELLKTAERADKKYLELSKQI